MSAQRFLDDAVRVLLLLLHANEGKKEMLKLALYEFEMIKKMSQEGSPAGDERIRTLIAAGDAATDMTTFAKVHRELVAKFEQHVPDMKFMGQDHLDGFFTELTFDKDGKPRKSERRVLSNIAPDAQAHIGYAVMLYIFQRQAELSKTAMTSMGATKTAQAIFKMKKKGNGGARVKFLNYATFFAYFGLVELIRENENGKPIIMLHLTDDGIAWWSRICMRTRVLFAKHEARIAQLEADLAALTVPGPKSPTPSKRLLGIAVAAILTFAASGGSARADDTGASVTNWAAAVSLMATQNDPASFNYNAPAVEESQSIAVSGISIDAIHSLAPADLTVLAASGEEIRVGVANPETGTTILDAFKQTSNVPSIMATDVMIQYQALVSEPEVNATRVNGWTSIQMPGKGSGRTDLTSTNVEGAFDVSNDKLGRPIGRLGETEPLDVASLAAMTKLFVPKDTLLKIDGGALDRHIDLHDGSYILDTAIPGAVTATLSPTSEDGTVDFGTSLNSEALSNWAKALTGTSAGVPPVSKSDSWAEHDVLANSLGRPVDRLGETEPLIMVSFTDGDT